MRRESNIAAMVNWELNSGPFPWQPKQAQLLESPATRETSLVTSSVAEFERGHSGNHHRATNIVGATGIRERTHLARSSGTR
jgi:hypothetical protein